MNSVSSELANTKIPLTKMTSKLKKSKIVEQEEENEFGDDTILYHVETNNNFAVLDNGHLKAKSKTIRKTDEKVQEAVKVDHENYMENLKLFFENFTETENENPKYLESMKNVILKGYNIFHISLSDVGKFNPNLKGYLSENLNKLEKCEELKEMVKAYDAKFQGEFKKNLDILINK